LPSSFWLTGPFDESIVSVVLDEIDPDSIEDGADYKVTVTVEKVEEGNCDG